MLSFILCRCFDVHSPPKGIAKKWCLRYVCRVCGEVVRGEIGGAVK